MFADSVTVERPAQAGIPAAFTDLCGVVPLWGANARPLASSRRTEEAGTRMERMCFLLEIQDGGGALYDSVHATMSPQLRQGLADCGYENYTIFRSGTTVVGYAECHPDVESVLRRQAELSTDELSPLASVVARPLRLADQVWRLQDDSEREKTIGQRPDK